MKGYGTKTVYIYIYVCIYFFSSEKTYLIADTLVVKINNKKGVRTRTQKHLFFIEVYIIYVYACIYLYIYI